MRKLLAALSGLVIVALLAGAWLLLRQPAAEPPAPPDVRSQPAPAPERQPLPGDRLLATWADPASPPIEDLRKVRAVVLGYFSVIKDVTRHPIGGNADLTACLLGENASRQPFLRADHPAVSSDRLLIDRWNTPLFVHPEAARELTLRSAGPDKALFTADDLILSPNGRKVPTPIPQTGYPSD